MKKKLVIILFVFAINAIAFTALKSAPSAVPDEEWRWITPVQCDCVTGQLGSGECQYGFCWPEPVYWACTDNIPCGDPFYFPK